ncbi:MULTISPECIES: TetR family transcriptional regulator [Spongiibacter]|jgi:AcrR family transcriptional regulator|uniref:TetR family transcriptional regulator n=2 Tax=Spongiibacteraceae TaxID=1706375 RepID=UPI0003B5B81C|nr:MULTISPECIES: TetR family transcriptional regulator [Spongiibacter]MAY39092.1 TetR family transcriptional regulator [Spongiibacter sp.]MBI57374.1 TetR family transcriptional regulator [Spongiibacter sp.]|tara:strand:- start:2220 stop:2822 length:603 start_codon:yes stop_codon:yes gene_type:complete
MTENKPKQSRKGNREKLMNAALGLLAEDQSGLSGISLRRITKACGLSPPAFYSHFASVEDLGMALVNEVGTALRELLRGVRDADSEEAVIAESVQAAFGYIRGNEPLFILIARERAGSSAMLRGAIRGEVREIVEDMATDFHERGLFERFDLERKRAAVAAIVSLGLSLIPDILDLSRESPETGDALIAEFENQVKLILF